MKYRLLKMKFSTPVHFGDGRLETSGGTLLADTLFSSVCSEIVSVSGETALESFVSKCREGKIKFSDCFPYDNKNFYLPKPMIELKDEKKEEEHRKKIKRLSYISSDKIDSFISLKIDIEAEMEKLKKIGKSGYKAQAAIFENRDAEPYTVGTYAFEDGRGLYFILGYEEEDDYKETAPYIESLGYSGIGGKKNSGFGKFTISESIKDKEPKFPKDIKKRLDGNYEKYMNISVGFPSENEMESVKGAKYKLLKRSGFIYSDSYNENQVKKKDFFAFNSGSCFDEKFEGDIFDLSSSYGKHPVYRYMMPLFLGVI